MHVLAIIYLTAIGLSFLPGSAFKVKPKLRDYNFDGPHVYFGFVATVTGTILSILTLVN